MQESNSLNSFGRLMTSLEGTSLTLKEKELISNKHIGGIILFSKNFESQLQDIQISCSQKIVADKTNSGGTGDTDNLEKSKKRSKCTIL